MAATGPRSERHGTATPPSHAGHRTTRTAAVIPQRSRAAFAQSAAPTGVRGTVTSLSGDLLKVHTRDGKDVDVKLAKDTPIRGVVLANVNDIKPDSYVGTAAIPQADGTLKAPIAEVFPFAQANAMYDRLLSRQVSGKLLLDLKG